MRTRFAQAVKIPSGWVLLLTNEALLQISKNSSGARRELLQCIQGRFGVNRTGFGRTRDRSFGKLLGTPPQHEILPEHFALDGREAGQLKPFPRDRVRNPGEDGELFHIQRLVQPLFGPDGLNANGPELFVASHGCIIAQLVAGMVATDYDSRSFLAWASKILSMMPNNLPLRGSPRFRFALNS